MPDAQHVGKESVEAAQLRGFHGKRAALGAEADGRKGRKTAVEEEEKTAAVVVEGEVAEVAATEVVVGRQTKGEDAANGEGRPGGGDHGVVHGDAHVHGDVHGGASACDTCRCQTSPPSGYLRHPEGERGSLKSRGGCPRHIL